MACDQGRRNANWLDECSLSEVMRAHQRQLRIRAAKKFSDSERWIWTTKLLEQSSDEKVARLISEAFPAGVRVLDICCGAGADSVALARRGPTLAVDCCEVACALTLSNLTLHFPEKNLSTLCVTSELSSGENELEVICSPAESLKISADSWIHLDPDRRSNTHRTTRALYFQPGPAFLKRAIESSAGGSIKLAPATKWNRLRSGTTPISDDSIDIDLSQIGRQFVSWGNSVRQQRWWWNIDPYPAGSITLSILDDRESWRHWTVTEQETFAYDDWTNIEDDWEAIQGFVGDTDGCVRAAGVQGLLAEKNNASRIGNQLGYFLKDEPPESYSPLIDWFHVEATMPFDRKRLRAYLRQKNVGILEIKVRNIPIVPETLRNELKLQGRETATVLITRCGTKTVAIVARRVQFA